MVESIIAGRGAVAGSNPAGRRQRHSKLIDLSGQTIGRWTVIDRAADVQYPHGKKRTMWNCVCECGYRARIGSRSLVQGASLSCGCLRADLLRGDKKGRKDRETVIKAVIGRQSRGRPSKVGRMDLTGETFGRWKVHARAEDRIEDAGRRRHLWACECECGVRKDVMGSDLIYGKSRSCGCLRREVLHEARRLARLRRQVDAVAAKTAQRKSDFLA